jgi:F0F1-type ATP synthase membrane subunit a
MIDKLGDYLIILIFKQKRQTLEYIDDFLFRQVNIYLINIPSNIIQKILLDFSIQFRVHFLNIKVSKINSR